MPSNPISALAKAVLPSGLYSAACKSYDRAGLLVQMLAAYGGPRQCPICEFRWKSFLPDPGANSPLFAQERIVGGGPHPESVCHWCGSFERERLVYLYLRDNTDICQAGKVVMHMAPERRIQEWLMHSMHGRYISVDLQSPLAEVHADICHLPFDDDYFDYVLCNHVLEHIPDHRRALSELFRVLKKGGTAILQVPIAVTRDKTEEDLTADEPTRLRRFGQRDHVRLYGRDYPEFLRKAGFYVHCVPTLDRLGQQQIDRYGLIADEVLFVASKGAT